MMRWLRSKTGCDCEPNDPETHCDLGGELYRQKRFPEAREAYDKAIELEPQSSQGWCGIGCAQIELREEAAAVASLERAVELDPESAAAQGNLGAALYKLGQVDRAVEHLRAAEELAKLGTRTGARPPRFHTFAPALALAAAFAPLRPDVLAGFQLHRGIEQLLEQPLHSVTLCERLLHQFFNRVT